MDFINLPYEMMIEILSRTSLTTFDTFRCTAKQSQTLTYDSYLLDLYKQRNNIVSGFLVQNKTKDNNYINDFAPSPRSNPIDLKFLPPKARILATCEQGLIVFEVPDYRNHRNVLYHVCKPATKQILALPNPKTRYFTVKVAIVVVGSNPFRYKIVRLSEHKESGVIRLSEKYRCEIFDSTTWAWKVVDILTLASGVFLGEPQPIIAKGSIYMLSTNCEIMNFDTYSETWTMLSSPLITNLEYHDHDSSLILVKYEGKLGFAHQPPNGCWEIWILKTDESWEKKHVLNVEKDIERGLLEGLYDSDTSVMKDYDKLLFHKFKRDHKDVEEVALRKNPHRMFVFRSDFETIDLKGRR